MLRRLDNLMFDQVYQPVVDRCPGAGPAGVARFFATGVIVVRAAVELEFSPHDYAMFGMVLIVTIACYVMADLPAARPGGRNPRRIAPAYRLWRLLSWVGVFVAVASLCSAASAPKFVDLAESILFLSFAYAVACDRMPPHEHASLRQGIIGRRVEPAQ